MNTKIQPASSVDGTDVRPAEKTAAVPESKGSDSLLLSIPKEMERVVGRTERIRENIGKEYLSEALADLEKDIGIFDEISETEQIAVVEYAFNESLKISEGLMRSILNSGNPTAIKFALLEIRSKDVVNHLSEIGKCLAIGDTLINSCACEKLAKAVEIADLDITPIIPEIIGTFPVKPEKKMSGHSVIEWPDLADFARVMTSSRDLDEGGAAMSLLIAAIKRDFGFSMGLIPHIDALIREIDETSLWRTTLLIGHVCQNGIRLADERYEDLLLLLNHENTSIRSNAATAILWMKQIGTDISSGIPKYEELLDDDDENTRISGITLFLVLVNYGHDLTKQVPKLAALLRDRSESVRGLAVNTLHFGANKGADISGAVKGLTRILEDSDEEYDSRVGAISAIHAFGKKTGDENVLSIVRPYLKSE